MLSSAAGKIVQQAVRMILEPIWELPGNIYLHFVQDLWIKKVVAKQSKSSVMFRRYADDSVVCFERKADAEAYLRALPARLAKFGLELATEKSALVKFNRWEGETTLPRSWKPGSTGNSRCPALWRNPGRKLDKPNTARYETIYRQKRQP